MIFLGTSGSIPTPQRSLPAILIKYSGEQLMFDCGEGTQRQIIKAKTGFHRKMKIFVSHMHGDHLFGLPGLLQTMSLLKRTRKIEIFGPHGIVDYLDSINETVPFSKVYPIQVNEILHEGVVCETPKYLVQANWGEHVIPNLLYTFLEKNRWGKFYPEKAKSLGVPKGPFWSRLQEGKTVTLADGRLISPNEVVGPVRPGRKIVYSGDSKVFERLVQIAEGADLLIHESTFADDLIDKAKEDGHSTPSQVGAIARIAKVKRLVLIHISARYTNSNVLLNQAKPFFDNTLVAQDLLELNLSLSKTL